MFKSNNLHQDFQSSCPIQHQDFVIKSATKVLELWGQGLDGTFTIKCENGRARLEMSFDLGYQDEMRYGNFNLSPSCQLFGSPRKSRSSPSTLRRSRARAEAYQLKKSSFETKNDECVLNRSPKEKVFAPDVKVPVAEASLT